MSKTCASMVPPQSFDRVRLPPSGGSFGLPRGKAGAQESSTSHCKQHPLPATPGVKHNAVQVLYRSEISAGFMAKSRRSSCPKLRRSRSFAAVAGKQQKGVAGGSRPACAACMPIPERDGRLPSRLALGGDQEAVPRSISAGRAPPGSARCGRALLRACRDSPRSLLREPAPGNRHCRAWRRSW